MAVVAVLLCVVWPIGGQVVIVPVDREAALAGVIREVHGYGPPGYGEDKRKDLRITYWVLDLPTVVNTSCSPERPEWASVDCKPTKRIRLFFPTLPMDNGLELKAMTMNEQKALVTGVLHRQVTAGQTTPIYMDVVDLQPLRSPSSAEQRPAH